MLLALKQEMKLRSEYLDGEPLKTIYFGGGTPSILDYDDLMDLFECMDTYFGIDGATEITLEANPDDLNPQKVRELRDTPVNRFSIGVQSFHDEDLQYMNRAHSAEEALGSVKRVQDAGWSNITIDLIYGVPTLTDEAWKVNMQTVALLSIPHLSAYALTVEERTALHHFIQAGKCAPLDEEKSKRHFKQLMDFMPAIELQQYEISNFAKKGFESKHNSSYWKGEKYIGIGPSAHSFNGQSRQWNIANNLRYIQSLKKGELCAELEQLTEVQQYNEYILTTLRTVWGCDEQIVNSRFSSFLRENFQKAIEKWLKSGEIIKNDHFFVLTEKGRFMADAIASDLFYVE